MHRSATQLNRHSLQDGSTLSSVLRLTLNIIANSLLFYALDRYVPQYVSVFGGIVAFLTLGLMLTLLNVLLRPVLNIISFPARFLFGGIVIIALNVLFLRVLYELVLMLDPDIVALAITGDIIGWMITGTAVGLLNAALKCLR